jgi:hypothetical protein
MLRSISPASKPIPSLPISRAMAIGPARGAGTVLRMTQAAVAVACGVLGLALAAQHPLLPWGAPALFLAWWLACMRWPDAWLPAVAAAVPVCSLALWTGWRGADELDLLLLAGLGAGHLRLAAHSTRRWPDAAQAATWRCVDLLALALWAWLLVGLARAWVDAQLPAPVPEAATGFANSLRAAKSLAYALLALPLLRQAVLRAPVGAARSACVGVVLALTGLSAGVLWERAAFPGLLEFSAHYRTVGLFWEMHVGGAAIDAFLAVAMPFSLWALVAARRPLPWSAAALLAQVLAYVCLTTFARGVYGAVLGGLVVCGVLLWRQRVAAGRAPAGSAPAGSAPAEPTLAEPTPAGPTPAGPTLAGTAPEGLALPGPALPRPAPAESAPAEAARAPPASASPAPAVPVPAWKRRAGRALALLLVLEVAAMVVASGFLGERLDEAERDLYHRWSHWTRGVALLQTPADWSIGLGLGRLPARYAGAGPQGEFPGAARVLSDPAPAAAGRFVRLYGPPSRAELAGRYALTQQIEAVPGARYRLSLQVRAAQTTRLLVYVCERHLLYQADCQVRRMLRLGRQGPGWQHVQLDLLGPALAGGPAWAPRLVSVGIAVAQPGTAVDLDDLRLTASGGPELLANGDFEQALDRWLPVVHRYFLPWHIDNLYLELLIERGVIGLLLCAALVGAAAWRLVFGAARSHPAAPYLAAALASGCALGLVSSVMDMPRVAFLFLLLTMLSLHLGPGPAESAAMRPARRL